MKKALLLFFIFNYCLFTLSAQSWLWAKQGNSYYPYCNSQGLGLGTNSRGDAFLTGVISGPVIFGKDTLTTRIYNPQMYLAKYNSAGVIQWGIQSTVGTGSVFPYVSGEGVIADKFGNSYLTGVYMDSLNLGNFHFITFEPSEMYLAKVDSSGHVVWVVTVPGNTGSSGGNSVTMENDSNGYIYVTGSVGPGTVHFGAYVLTSPSSSMFLAKYSAINGNVIWAVQSTNFTAGSNSSGTRICVDKSNHIYITGSFIDTTKFGTVTLYAQNTNTFIVKYDSSGNVIWAKNPLSPITKGTNAGSSITTDKYGNPYITGGFTDSLYFESIKLYSKSSDIYVAKYDTGGNVLWAQAGILYDTTYALSYSIGADTLNNIFVTGAKAPYPGITSIQFGSVLLKISKQFEPSFIFQFDYAGNALCGSIIPSGGGSGSVNTVAVSSSGQYIYCSNGFIDTMYLGPDTLIAPFNAVSHSVPFVARWQPCSISTNQPETKPLDITLTIFPNPFNTSCDIVLPKSHNTLTPQFLLYSIDGRKIEPDIKGSGENYILNGSNLPDGLYILSVNYDGTKVYKKLVVSR